MLSRIFPKTFDNNYRGRRPAIWLFAAAMLLTGLQGAFVIGMTRQTLPTADGISLDNLGATGTSLVVSLTALLGLFTLVSYLFLYTPLKRQTPLCVLVGALAGATPPLIGWAASAGGLSPGAWVLYAVLFLWQFPHFMAIAWMYREDYDRAGYVVIP